MTTGTEKPGKSIRRSWRVPISIAVGTAAVVAAGLLVVARASSHTNKVALAGTSKGVTIVEAKAAQYQPSRRYVGTIEPWVEAKIGPQLISGYVDTVLVRPGDAVKRGQVIATIDCRNASASSKVVSMQARAIQTQQEAMAHEAARIAELKEGGFASPNEIEKHAADSASKAAELMETQAKMQRATLEVDDCVLRAPFAGEVAVRAADPGAFAHPGMAVATLVDRTTARVVAEVPEADFDLVAPTTTVRIIALATNRQLRGTIARRSPAADFSTRTIHVEIDIPDPNRTLPVGTTAEISMDVGQPVAATEIPLIAASVRGGKATVFVVDGDVAKKSVYLLKGERGGSLFLEPALRPGSHVVTEGRALLKDGDRVAAQLEAAMAGADEVKVAGIKL